MGLNLALRKSRLSRLSVATNLHLVMRVGFVGPLKTSCLETESQHIGIRAWITEDHRHACS